MKNAAADVVYNLSLTRNPIVDSSQIKPGGGKGRKGAKARTARKRSKIGRGTYRGETARR